MVENELKVDENIYRQLIEHLQDILFIVSPDWQTIHFVSRSYEDIWGQPRESLLKNPLSWIDSIYPDDRQRVMHYLDEKSRGDLVEISFPEYRVVRPDGSIKWLKTRGLPMRDDAGEVSHIAGTVIDITEQKKKEIDLALSKEVLQMVLEGSQQGFWDWNIETGDVRRNDYWAQMLGYATIKDFEDNTDTWANLIHPDDRDAAWASINDHVEGRTVSHKMEYRMRTKDGSYRWILDHAKVVQRDVDGSPMRMSGTHIDITDRKQMEKERDELIVSLQRALVEIKTLKGIIPICSYCHSIRDDEGAWGKLEAYFSRHSDAEFSHGICPECLTKALDEIEELKDSKN